MSQKSTSNSQNSRSQSSGAPAVGSKTVVGQRAALSEADMMSLTDKVYRLLLEDFRLELARWEGKVN